MITPRSVIPILSFRAGPLPLAIAAEDVQAVRAARPGVPHIASLLGVESHRRSFERRTIHITTATRGAHRDLDSDESDFFAFLADLPVEVVRCHAGDVLPMGQARILDHWQPVMGFARIDGLTLTILDIPSVVDMLKSEGGQS